MSRVLHASLAAAFLDGRWRGALLLGPSEAGKSDLVLRLCTQGWRLVADDRVLLWTCGGEVFGRAPPALAGLVELRGQGMASLPWLAFAEVALAVRLGEPDERQPQPEAHELEGVLRPRHTLRPFDASAPARLSRLLSAL